jgi:hypothetical protein
VTRRGSTLMRQLGEGDRRKMTEYLDAIRDVERRIQLAEQSSQELPSLEKPAGIPEDFEEHARLMFDLQVLAIRADLTRVMTFMFGHELSNRAYREIGVSDPHHPMSHHRGDPDKLTKLQKINAYHTKNFAYYLQTLKTTPDGDGMLLDNMVVLYGASMSNSDLHANYDLPTLLFGTSKLRGGRHVRFTEEPPKTNLYLTLLDMVGTPVDNLGDSTGKLNLLSL